MTMTSEAKHTAVHGQDGRIALVVSARRADEEDDSGADSEADPREEEGGHLTVIYDDCRDPQAWRRQDWNSVFRVLQEANTAGPGTRPREPVHLSPQRQPARAPVGESSRGPAPGAPRRHRAGIPAPTMAEAARASRRQTSERFRLESMEALGFAVGESSEGIKAAYLSVASAAAAAAATFADEGVACTAAVAAIRAVDDSKAKLAAAAAAAAAGAGQPKAAPAPRRAPAFRWKPGEAERRDSGAILPIRHEDIWAFRKKLEANHWTAQQVSLAADRKDWERMGSGERLFVQMQLAFFARIDIDVLKNINENLSQEVDCLEAEFYYAEQAAQECVHAESYDAQIEAVMDGAERERVMNAVRTMPVIGRMRDWVRRWCDSALPVEDRLVAAAAIEGVMFSASFCGLQWARGLNVLPGITEANDYIARDEGVHTLFSCLLVRAYLVAKPPEEKAHAIFAELVEVLDDFVRKSLPDGLRGMNAKLMRQYVRFQADCVLDEMGYGPVWRVGNPFPFMDKLTLNGVAKTNFFEKIVTQYQGITDEKQSRFALDQTPADPDSDDY